MSTGTPKKESAWSRGWRAIKRVIRFDLVRLIPFTSEAWHARRYNERVQRRFRRALEKLGPRTTGAQREEVYQDWQYELDEAEEEEQGAYTRRLLHRARSLLVSVPARDGKELNGDTHWEQGHTLGTWYLTRAGIARIRTAIRDEEKARREARAHWVVWVSALTGLVGAATGLLAIILRSRSGTP